MFSFTPSLKQYRDYIYYIPQEVLHKIEDKSITHNKFKIKDNESIMCRFCCFTFIEYIFSGKTLLDYPISFVQMTIKIMTK